MNWIFWLVVMIAALVIEAASINMISVWFSAGALAALIANFAGAGATAEIIIFLIVSLLGLLLFIFYFKPKYVKEKKQLFTPTNADRLIGREGVVLETIVPLENRGLVLVMGQEWSALPEDGISEIAAQSHILVKGIRGVHLLVEPCQNKDVSASEE